MAVGRPAVIAGIVGFLAAGVLACSGGAVPATPTSAPAPTSVFNPTPAPTVIPTSTPKPTDAPTPTFTSVPTPGRRVDSTPPVPGLTDLAFGYLTELVEGLGPRESATGQERAAAEYLATQLEGFGYAVELQPFAVKSLSAEVSGVALDGPVLEPLNSLPLVKSGTADASGVLVPVGRALDGDIPEGGLEGKIALAERGLISFEAKVNRAAAAGAIAVVIYNDRPGNFQRVLAGPHTIPVLSITRIDGRRLEELASGGTVELRVSVKLDQRLSHNVIAEHQRSGDGVVILGAHYDTVPNLSGAGDNGSGTAVLLAVAGELSRQSLPFTLRFIAFGSEELGLLGSRHYVDSMSPEDRRRVRAMLNFDALGNGDGVGILGNEALTGLAAQLGTTLGIDLEISSGLQGGGSDHMSFAGAGIPVVMFFGRDFSLIHTPGDTLESVTPHLLGDAAGVALALLESPDFQTILN